MITFTEVTENIVVKVHPVYLDEHSDAMVRRFVFGYYIRIRNEGSEEVQLLRRHWFIQDGRGSVREVEGLGVVGVQPVIRPGDTHEYNSYCVLDTFEGSMQGTYLMQRSNGDRFRVNIPRFVLRAGAN